MCNPETLFLINDQKSQIFKLHIFGKDSVSSDDHIHLTLFQIFDGFFLLCRSPETAEQFHAHRKLFHSLDKSIINLLRQNRCRRQIRHLSALLHFLESRTQGNFCFPIADISADQTVHDLRALHIPLGIFNGAELILCLLIRKHFLKLSLPYRIRTTDIAFFFLTHRIKFHQFFCDIFYRTTDFAFGLIPFLSAKFIQLRHFRSIRSGIFLQTVKLSCQNIKIAASPVLNLDIILDDPVHFHLLDSTVNSQSMLLMNNEISDGKFCEILNPFTIIILFLLLFFLLLAENI